MLVAFVCAGLPLKAAFRSQKHTIHSNFPSDIDFGRIEERMRK